MLLMVIVVVVCLFVLISSLSIVIEEVTWYYFNFLKFSDVWSVTQDLFYPGEYSVCTCEESLVFCIWMECPEDTNDFYASYLSFKTCVSLLIFCFDDMPIAVSGVLKFPATIGLLSISHLYLLVFVLCLWFSYVGSIDIYNCYVFLFDWFLEHYIMSFLISCHLYIKVYFVWYEVYYLSIFWIAIYKENIFHSLTFSLYMYWGLKCVSCRKHICGSYFCIHSASLCLLVGVFNLFISKVSIDIDVPIDIFLFFGRK